MLESILDELENFWVELENIWHELDPFQNPISCSLGTTLPKLIVLLGINLNFPWNFELLGNIFSYKMFDSPEILS